MSLTQDEYIRTDSATSESVRLSQGIDINKDIKVNPGNPFAQLDYGIIVKAFEVESSNWDRTDYAKVSHYRDVYSTENFAIRVREQMNYYPGMHQTSSGASGEDPFYTNANEMAQETLGFWNNAMDNPDAFMTALRQKQQDFDYGKIFGSDVSAETRAKELGKMITECVPCFDRLLDGMQLLPDGDLLEIHMLNIKLRTDLIDKIMQLFKDPGMYINICDLLHLLSHMCPKDLIAMMALLTQYLAKLNLDFRFNLDFIIQLVGPILSPFLDALSQWLDKWIQLILAPMICVVDHINETIIIAQSAKIPFSEVSSNIGMDLGVAAPGQKNAAGEFGFGGSTGIGDASKSGLDSEASPHASTWTAWQWEEFNTPDEEKYNPTVPTPPAEETALALQEAKDGWSNEKMSEAERAERNAKWEELKARELEKRRYVPPPDRYENHDGTRWSKDDIPNSEKHITGGGWEKSYNPPEKQQHKPSEGTKYLDPAPLVNSVVQMRNIMQGGIQYIKDWFTYITQMIYDLLGTDFGWMTKKTDNTMLKSRIIELIMLIVAILQAVAKNGLECSSTSTNFDQGQLKYILEEGLNKFSTTKFKVADDGTITILPAGRSSSPDIQDFSNEIKQVVDTGIDGTVPGQKITEPTAQASKQKVVESGIIIKDCFRNVTRDDLEKARAWIADFEKRGII